MATAQQRPLPRPYRDFLAPTLHRRFTNAVILALVVCYVEAVWMGEYDPIWSWFPLGWAGLRTFLLFISILAVFILRVAQMHVGARTTTSPFQSFLSYSLRYSTAQTLAWYSFSAWFFSEVYLWSAPREANLAMVDPGKPYERPRLNERPIYLRTMFLCLALAQSTIHLCRDYDRVPFPVSKASNFLGRKNLEESLVSQLQRASLTNVRSAVFRMAIMTVIGPIVYAMFLRRTAWEWTYAVAKLMFALPRSSHPPRYPPYVADLIGRFFIEGVQLVFLWEFTNTAFTVFLAQEPVKKAAPLTTDSKDPNGSLLAGLKAKKEIPRNTAFWELRLISHFFPTRRSTIYTELDRPGGSSTWSQILAICLGELHDISARIQNFQHPPSAPNGSTPEIHSLPRISGSIKQDNILSPAPQAHTVTAEFGSFAKAHGQNANSHNPISPRARKLLEISKAAFLSKPQQEELSPSGISRRIHAGWLDFLKTSAGIPFRKTFARRASTVVFGGRTSVAVVANAVDALAKLAVCSLKEDKYGRVQGDVAGIIRTYTAAIGTVEGFVVGLDVDSTDVEFVDKRVPEVEAVVRGLREGLGEMIGAFEEFREDLGLSIREMRVAREVVAATPSEES